MWEGRISFQKPRCAPKGRGFSLLGLPAAAVQLTSGYAARPHLRGLPRPCEIDRKTERAYVKLEMRTKTEVKC